MSDDPAPRPGDPDVPDGGAHETPQDPAPGAAPSPSAGDSGEPPHAGSETPDAGSAYQAATRVSPWGFLFIAGLAGFLASWAWYRVEDDTGWVTQVSIFLSALLTLAPIAWHAVDFFQSVASRRGGAFLAVCATVALGFVVMVVVSALNIARQETLPAIDLTETGRYTLGEETTKILAKVDGTVYATYLERPGSRTSDPLRQMAIEQLRVYGYHTNKVQVRVFDDLRENEAATRYLQSKGVVSTSSGENDDVIVFTFAPTGREVAVGKQKELKVEEFAFAKAGSADGQPRWLGERVITSAIQELVFVQMKAYAVGGHGERGLADQMRQVRERLRAQNVDVSDTPLNLASSPKVPDDCDLLLVLGPDSEYQPAEVAAIRTWLDKGHALFVTVDVDPTATRRTTGLEHGLLDDFGLGPRIDTVVLAPELQEIRGGTVVSMSPVLTVTVKDYTGHASVEPLRRGGGFATRFLNSTYVAVEKTPSEGLTIDPVVWAPDPGMKDVPRPFAARVSKERRDYRTPGPSDVTNEKLPLIAVATRDLPPGPDGARRDARVILCGDTDVFTDAMIQQNAPNADLFGGLVQWGLRRADLAAVSDKTLDLELVTIGDREHRMAFWWPLVVALSALLAGAAVWWARRR